MSRIVKAVLLNLLRGYKWAVSPMLPPACRYVPTCSEYAMEAVERQGVMRGTALAVWRVLRCHPFARGGFDPVPVERSFAPPESGPPHLAKNAPEWGPRRRRLSPHEHDLAH